MHMVSRSAIAKCYNLFSFSLLYHVDANALSVTKGSYYLTFSLLNVWVRRFCGINSIMIYITIKFFLTFEFLKATFECQHFCFDLLFYSSLSGYTYRPGFVHKFVSADVTWTWCRTPNRTCFKILSLTSFSWIFPYVVDGVTRRWPWTVVSLSSASLTRERAGGRSSKNALLITCSFCFMTSVWRRLGHYYFLRWCSRPRSWTELLIRPRVYWQCWRRNSTGRLKLESFHRVCCSNWAPAMRPKITLVHTSKAWRWQALPTVARGSQHFSGLHSYNSLQCSAIFPSIYSSR